MKNWGGVRFGTRIADSRTAEIEVPPDIALRPSSRSVARVAGTTAISYGSCGVGLTCLSAASACVVGGDPVDLQVGDAVDFWRVEVSNRAEGCGWLPKCDYRAGLGWSSR